MRWTQANQLTDIQLVAQPGGLAFGFAPHILLVPPGSPHPSAKGYTNRLSPRNSESSRYVPLAHWPACGYKSSNSINVTNRADSAFPPRLTPRSHPHVVAPRAPARPYRFPSKLRNFSRLSNSLGVHRVHSTDAAYCYRRRTFRGL